MILRFDHVELGVDILGDVANERKNLANTIVHSGKCGQEVDDGMGNRGRVLHENHQLILDERHIENRNHTEVRYG